MIHRDSPQVAELRFVHALPEVLEGRSIRESLRPHCRRQNLETHRVEKERQLQRFEWLLEVRFR